MALYSSNLCIKCLRFKRLETFSTSKLILIVRFEKKKKIYAFPVPQDLNIYTTYLVILFCTMSVFCPYVHKLKKEIILANFGTFGNICLLLFPSIYDKYYEGLNVMALTKQQTITCTTTTEFLPVQDNPKNGESHP